MIEIDLIPADYRELLARRNAVMKYTIALVAIVVLIVTTSVVLAHLTDERRARSAQLKLDNAITQQQQAQLEQLEEQQTELERRWSLLRGLRAGAAIDDIFSLIDRSIIEGDLWFLNWSFRRAGVVVDGEQRGVETGYFIIVADNDSASARPDLSVETHMTIRGQATDHQALSKFVRALFEQPDIKDVNVRKTSQTDYANRRVVEFDMTVVLHSAFMES